MKSDASILIILTGSLGDIARGIIVLPKLKEAFPECHITWLVEDKWADFLLLHPLIEELIVFERSRGLSAVFSLWAELRARSFDITLDMQRHLKSGFFSFISGAPRRIGFHRRNAKEGNWLFNNEHIQEWDGQQSKVLHYLSFCRVLDVDSAAPGDFGLRVEIDRVRTPRLLPKSWGRFIALVLGSSWESKDWEETEYQRLIGKFVSETSYGVVLLGDRSQALLAERLMERSPPERVLNLCDQTSLQELCAILTLAEIGIGPDSGPGHVAAACGTQYVSLFGATDARRVAPFGSESLVINANVPCSPCMRRQCPRGDRLCMKSIFAEQVFERALSISG